MRALKLRDDIYWVGAVDWASRDFHGYSRSPWGTTYNAYLVKDEKVTLFDTVKREFAGSLMCSMSHVLDSLEQVDYIVVNHLEPDHAGSLDELVAACKPEKIFCSPMCEKAMGTYFPQYKDWPVEVVKTGETLSLGKRTVEFVETKMLHWPDSMFSYIPEEKMLISNDAFGQNIASTERFVDEVDRGLVDRLMREYYGNIVLPFSPIVLKTLEQVTELGLEIDLIAPDHGLMFRGDDVQYALKRYQEFAEQKPTMKAVVVYDTMWHSTEELAGAITQGLQEEGVSVHLLGLKQNHHSAVMTEVMDAGAVVVGSPTHNNGILPYMAAMLQYMKGLKPKNKIGGAFGSFGWSGESTKILTDWMEGMGIEMPQDPLRFKNAPTHEMLAQAAEWGRNLGRALKEKVGA